MTATDELRKLLDERGVEHSDFASAYRLSTRWQDNSRRVIEHQLRKDADIGDMGIVRNLTPEQAVAATVRRGTCKVESSYVIEFDTLISTNYYEFDMRCGYRFSWSDNEPPDYCPGCGRKVVHDGS